MPESSFLGLAQNISLLLALVVVFDSLGAHPLARPAFVRQAASGVLLGGIGVVVMLTSWVLSPGVVFDTRSVLLGISGLFFGPLPTTIAMALTAALRLYQGGSGAFTGVLVILATGTLGLAWRQLRKQPLEKTNWQELYLFGLVSHLVMLALMLTLPWETAQRVLANISLPVLTLYPLGTVLLGILLTNRLRRETLQAALHQTTARLNATQQLSKIGGWDWDVARQSMFWTEETYRLHGFSPAEFPPGSTDHIQQSLACYDPTDRPVVQAAFQHCAEQGRPYNLELRFTPRGGEQMWIRTQAEAVVERGQVVRVVGNFMDITERKQAERHSVRASCNWLRLSTTRAMPSGSRSRAATCGPTRPMWPCSAMTAKPKCWKNRFWISSPPPGGRTSWPTSSAGPGEKPRPCFTKPAACAKTAPNSIWK
jgi:PAS domain S-box-containing protein